MHRYIVRVVANLLSSRDFERSKEEREMTFEAWVLLLVLVVLILNQFAGGVIVKLKDLHHIRQTLSRVTTHGALSEFPSEYIHRRHDWRSTRSEDSL